MRSLKAILLALILHSGMGGNRSFLVSGQESPTLTSQKKECTLGFQYFEDPGVSLGSNPVNPKKFHFISDEDRATWLKKVSKSKDGWMMKQPVEKTHTFGSATRGHFADQDRNACLCNYQITLEPRGNQVEMDLMVSVWMGEPKTELGEAVRVTLTPGETIVLQSRHPGKNINRVLLVTLKN